jgi:hypothetical protein
VRVAPIKPTLKAPATRLLKLTYVKLLSSFAFKFNLRRYTKGGRALLTVGMDDMARGFFRTSTRPTLIPRSNP